MGKLFAEKSVFAGSIFLVLNIFSEIRDGGFDDGCDFDVIESEVQSFAVAFEGLLRSSRGRENAK
jgi:hypothetical protein